MRHWHGVEIGRELMMLLGPNHAQVGLLLSCIQFSFLFVVQVDALIVCFHVHVFSIEVEDSCVATRRVKRVVEVVELDEENLVQALLSLWNVAPNYLPVKAAVARDFSPAFPDEL